jgi:hypothetical protein
VRLWVGFDVGKTSISPSDGSPLAYLPGLCSCGACAYCAGALRGEVLLGISLRPYVSGLLPCSAKTLLQAAYPLTIAGGFSLSGPDC